MKRLIFTLIFTMLVVSSVWSVPTYAEDHPDPTSIEVNE